MLSQAKLDILDGLGTALLSTRLEKPRAIARAVRSLSSGRSSRVWGYGFSTNPLASATINGMLVEALDYGDIHLGGGLHPTCVILPATVAYAENTHASGRMALLAYVIGCEAMIRLGAAGLGVFHERGFQPTSIAGVLGAALATSRIAGSSPRQVEDAVAIATNLSFGSSLTVRVGAYLGGVDTGRAAETGILATELAKNGVRGIVPDPVGGRFGFLEAYAGHGRYDARRITSGLGRTWEIGGTFLKRYPTSIGCTSVLDACIRLHPVVGDRVSQIKRITFGESRSNIAVFASPEKAKRRPSSIYEAKTSYFFLVALALLRGRVDPAGLERFGDRGTVGLAERVTAVVDEKSRWVQVEFIDGSKLKETQDELVGTSQADVRRKYFENAEPVIGERARELESLVDSLEDINDVREMTTLLVA